MKVKYIGQNPSYTAGKARFTKRDTVKEVDAKMGKYLMKTEYFEEVKDNEQPNDIKEGRKAEGGFHDQESKKTNDNG